MNARQGLLWTAIAIGGVLLIGYAALQWQKPLLDLGVGYGARVACGCRYIGNRSLDDCYKDFEPGMQPVRLKEDAATRTITAYVPFTTSRAVSFDPVLGCQPEPFAEQNP